MHLKKTLKLGINFEFNMIYIKNRKENLNALGWGWR